MPQHYSKDTRELSNLLTIRRVLQIPTYTATAHPTCLLGIGPFLKSLMIFGFIYWWRNLSLKNRHKRNIIINISSQIAGCYTTDNSLELLYKSGTMQMARKILSGPKQFLHEQFVLHLSLCLSPHIGMAVSSIN